MFYQLFSAADFRSALVDVVSAGGDTHAAIAWALPALMCVGAGTHSPPQAGLCSSRERALLYGAVAET